MPTIFTHPAVPLAIGWALGTKILPSRLLVAGTIASIIPDLDVVGFRWGISYASAWGHRGFSHSLIFALALAVLGAMAYRSLRASPATTFLFLFLASASHGILDSFTNGGLGIAFLWPWSAQRFFAPVQIIEVAPLGLHGLFSSRGLLVLESELLWVWLPGMSLAFAFASYRRYKTEKVRRP